MGWIGGDLNTTNTGPGEPGVLWATPEGGMQVSACEPRGGHSGCQKTESEGFIEAGWISAVYGWWRPGLFFERAI
jgi:hypothetical protein